MSVLSGTSSATTPSMQSFSSARTRSTLVLGRFDDQFVVYLQDQPRAQVLPPAKRFARRAIIASLMMSAAVP